MTDSPHPRRAAVVAMTKTGHTARQIGEALDMAQKTVAVHRARARALGELPPWDFATDPLGAAYTKRGAA